MKRTAVIIAAALAAALFQGAAYSQGDAGKAEALAKQATCLNCHAVDTKKVGPAFKDVAKKYKGSNADKVVAQMKSKPVHQSVAKAVKAQDLKTIISWVLTR
jgi:cytochrome c